MGRTGQEYTINENNPTKIRTKNIQIEVIFQILVLFPHPGDHAETYSSHKIYLV